MGQPQEQEGQQAGLGHARAALDAAIRMRMLLEVTAALTRAATARDVAGAVASRVASTLGARAASICAIDHVTRAIDVLAAPGYDADTVARWPRFSLDAQLPIAHVARAGTAMWIERAADVAAWFSD